MGGLSPTHWLIVGVVCVFLFGSRRLPDLARSMGRSLRIFQSEIKEMRHDGMESSDEVSPRTDLPSPAPLQPKAVSDAPSTPISDHSVN